MLLIETGERDNMELEFHATWPSEALAWLETAYVTSAVVRVRVRVRVRAWV